MADWAGKQVKSEEEDDEPPEEGEGGATSSECYRGRRNKFHKMMAAGSLPEPC